MNRLSRRTLLRSSAMATIAVPCIKLGIQEAAFAQDELPRVSADDPTAVALGYVNDTAEVDAATNPTHAIEQQCANCQLIQAAEGEWRACAIFPGKVVNENGWCKSWVKKA